MSKIYISGKITGLPIEQARKKFREHEAILADLGHEVFNPFHSTEHLINATWSEYMTVCVGNLLECDSIYMLSDWGQSKGARIEYAIAKEMNLKIYYE